VNVKFLTSQRSGHTLEGVAGSPYRRIASSSEMPDIANADRKYYIQGSSPT
jgi:hypothetical protein